MNYYEPRQIDPEADRADAGKWRYTCMNNGRIWAVGYCAQRCSGHDDPGGAFAHQCEYERDFADFHVGPAVEEALQRFECEAEIQGWNPSLPEAAATPDKCGKLTTSYARVGPGIGHHVYLCSDHLTPDGLAVAYAVGRVISS